MLIIREAQMQIFHLNLLFLDYQLAHGMDFGATQSTAWAGVILNTADVSPAWKLNRIDTSDLFAEPR